MTDMILVYITCVNENEAKKIGEVVLAKRLTPCYNIILQTYSAAFWPPKTGEVERVNGSVLLIKTLESKYNDIEAEVRKLHSDKTPCIIAFPVAHVFDDYYRWLKKELE